MKIYLLYIFNSEIRREYFSNNVYHGKPNKLLFFSQLILQPEYFQHELVKKFRRAACIDLSDHIETEENDICTFTEGKRTQWLNRFNERFMSMMSDVFYKNHKNWYVAKIIINMFFLILTIYDISHIKAGIWVYLTLIKFDSIM